MEKILDTFKSMLANNPDCTVNFPIDADDPESIKFIQYLCENNGLIEHNGKVVFCPFGNTILKPFLTSTFASSSMFPCPPFKS